MKKLLVFLLFSISAFAQVGYYSQPLFIGKTPAANVPVRVCTAGATGVPCTPVANIYLDSGLTQPISQPGFTSDGLGNLSFFAAPAFYVCQSVYAQVTTNFTCAIAGVGSTSVAASPPSSVQFNNAGATSGSSNFLWDNTNHVLELNGSVVFGGTVTKQISGGPEWLSFQSPVANRVTEASFVGVETSARWLKDAQGNEEWGPGGAVDQNVLFGWSATGRMSLSGTSGGGLNIVRWTAPGVLEAQPRISLSNDGSGICLSDGTNPCDVSMYRPTASQLNLQGTIGVVNSLVDAFPRVTLDAAANGIKFGNGTLAPDTLLYRSVAGVIGLGSGQSFLPTDATGQALGGTSNRWDFIGRNISYSGQVTSTVVTGTAPFNVTSTTVVPNLNVSQLLGQTWTGPTISAPVINGTPTGTGIPTATLKTGTGGGNYTTASTSYVRVDSTNLAYTVTIPTGWKLMIAATASIVSATNPVQTSVALADGGADNTGILVEVVRTGSNTTSFGVVDLHWAVNGDGASHTINMQFKTANASDSATIANSSSTLLPAMTFLLTPSN